MKIFLALKMTNKYLMNFMSKQFKKQSEIKVINIYYLNYDYIQFGKCLKRTHSCYINLAKKLKQGTH